MGIDPWKVSGVLCLRKCYSHYSRLSGNLEKDFLSKFQKTY